MNSRDKQLIAGAAAATIAGAFWLDTWRRISRVEHGFPRIGALTRSTPRLHYLARGSGRQSGRDVVLLHGAWVMLQDFTSSGLVDMVAQQHRVFAFDRPGYGFSERPDSIGSPFVQARVMREAIASLGIERPILVGHSYSGPLALAYAAQFPDEVAGVVFVSGLAFPTPRVDLLPFMLPATPLVGDAIAHALLPAYEALLTQVLRLCFAPHAIPEDFKREMPREMMLRPPQLEAAAEDLAALVPSLVELQRHYGSLDMPVAVVAGEADRIASAYFHAVPLSRALPHARLTLVPDVGHMLHHFRPDAIVAAIDDVAERSNG
jgi:pimeloyl-ACP methyl ester carboxylesterase